MSRKRFSLLLLMSTSVTMAASCTPTVVAPNVATPGASARATSPASTATPVSTPAAAPAASPATVAAPVPATTAVTTPLAPVVTPPPTKPVAAPVAAPVAVPVAAPVAPPATAAPGTAATNANGNNNRDKALLAPPAAPVFPKLIAHRAGTYDQPENTLEAIDAALKHGSDMIWLSVQLSQDNVPVLYRPADLSALTDGKGPVDSMTVAQLKTLNAGHAFVNPPRGQPPVYPYRNKPVRIPTLQEALQRIPPNVPVILDMKALPAQRLAAAVVMVMTLENAWGRVLVYSTDAQFQTVFASYPRVRLFESRDATRKRLVDITLSLDCAKPRSGTWAGFEIRREMWVTEKFTMGKGETATHAELWNRNSVYCYRRGHAVNLVAFGVNSEADYCLATKLKLDAVMVDSPEIMSSLRAKLEKDPAPCGIRPTSSGDTPKQ